MASSTVNIADFRCRLFKGRAYHPVPRTGRSGSSVAGPRIVASKPTFVTFDTELHDGTNEQGNGSVCDIATARRAQFLRRPVAVRPISIRRRSNVIRFGEPKVREMRALNTGVHPKPSASSNDFYDLPPAA